MNFSDYSDLRIGDIVGVSSTGRRKGEVVKTDIGKAKGTPYVVVRQLHLTDSDGKPLHYTYHPDKLVLIERPQGRFIDEWLDEAGWRMLDD